MTKSEVQKAKKATSSNRFNEEEEEGDAMCPHTSHTHDIKPACCSIKCTASRDDGKSRQERTCVDPLYGTLTFLEVSTGAIVRHIARELYIIMQYMPIGATRGRCLSVL